MSLADRIEKRIREIPASDCYITAARNTLGSVLSRELLRRIAEEAAAEMTDAVIPALRQEIG